MTEDDLKHYTVEDMEHLEKGLRKIIEQSFLAYEVTAAAKHLNVVLGVKKNLKQLQGT